MTGTVRLAARRLALFGPPLTLGVLSFTHPIALITRDLAPQADWFITLHVLQVVLFALIGLGVSLLIEGVRGPLAVTSRAGLAVFVVFLARGTLWRASPPASWCATPVPCRLTSSRWRSP